MKDGPCSTSPCPPGRYLQAGLSQGTAPRVPGRAEEGLGRLVLVLCCQGMHFSQHHSTQQLAGKGMQLETDDGSIFGAPELIMRTME